MNLGGHYSTQYTHVTIGVMILPFLENYPIIVVTPLKVKSAEGGELGCERSKRRHLGLNILNWPKREAGGQRRADCMERRSSNLNCKSSVLQNMLILQMGNLRPRKG